MADFSALLSWCGVFGAADQYEVACGLLEERNPNTMVIDGKQVVVWDFGGPGTADLVRVSGEHISVVRIWPAAEWTEDQIEGVVRASASARVGSAVDLHLTISTGYLLALWAPESALGFSAPRGLDGVPEGLSIGDGGVYAKVVSGRYAMSTSEWQDECFEIVKLDLYLVAGEP